MRKVQKILSYILVAALASGITLFAADYAWSQKKISKLDQLSGLIQERFIGESDKTAYEDAAANAMVNALGDEWSYYIPASQLKAHQETMNNAYVGVGITITVREEGDGFLVTKVNTGGPAEEAGMLPGDVIVEIEGQSATGMSADAARDLVRGEANTQVNLKIQRGSDVISMAVTRKEVLTAVATAQMLEDNIGLITIANFDARCYEESKAAIDQLLAEGAVALMFDVRNNPGGYKDELVKLLDDLLPEGVLFRAEDYKGNVQTDQSNADFLDLPMAVLVNGYSYSAAEFFAAALMEYEAATVVGQQTYGKGYFQTTIYLNDGSAVGLSVGKYTTPNGKNLAGVGITPDIVIEVDEVTDAAIYAGTLEPANDPQIQAAVKALTAN